MDIVEDQLEAILKAAEPPADENFSLRVERLIIAENQMRASSRAGWRRFFLETAATVAVLAAAYLLWNFAPPLDHRGIVQLSSPAFIGLLVVAVWIASSLESATLAEGFRA